MAIDPYANCNPNLDRATVVCTWETCCLAQSPFLYLPNRGGNIFFAVFFGILLLPQLGLGIRYRTWGFLAGMIIGLVLEVIGYAARVNLNAYPWGHSDFLTYLITLTIAPVFISAAIYLTLSRIVILYGSQYSRLAPRTIAISFMASDLCSLVLQAIGGGLADSDDKDNSTTGRWIMVAGLLLQAISLGAFLLLAADFFLRCRGRVLDKEPARIRVRARIFFRAFLAALLLATLVILIRSIFRVVELWGGFAGDVWNSETDFFVLDGAMMALAVVCLSVLHPGLAFDGLWPELDWSRLAKNRDILLAER